MSENNYPLSQNEAILRHMVYDEELELREPQSRNEALLLQLAITIDKIRQLTPPVEDGDYKLHVSDGSASWEKIT